MRPKSSTLGPCDICKKPVSELGSYVKMALGRWAHGQCFYDVAYSRGKIDAGVEQEAERRAEAEREARESQERQARERAMEERRLEVAERERTNRILAQREMPLPPRVDREEAARRAIAEGRSVTLGQAPAEPERPKSRFELIELDEPGEEKKE